MESLLASNLAAKASLELLVILPLATSGAGITGLGQHAKLPSHQFCRGCKLYFKQLGDICCLPSFEV